MEYNFGCDLRSKVFGLVTNQLGTVIDSNTFIYSIIQFLTFFFLK